MVMSEWTGDLKDDCHLWRYEYRAHVECMGRGEWWFEVGKGTFPDYESLYNTADNETAVNLTTGKMARAAAECIIEYLNHD
jgi:hypothetical protein